MNPEKPIVMCRQASDALKPGAVKGYFCRSCGKELQVSSVGVRQIRELDGVPCCQSCALTLVQKFNALGHPGDLVLSEQAQQQMKEQGIFDQVIAGKEVVEITPDEFFDIMKLRQKMQGAAGN